MLTRLLSGWLADRIGRVKVLFIGLGLAILTPSLYGSAHNISTMAIIYGLNGVAFWTMHTVGFAFAGDIIPKGRRGRLLSRYNTVMALSWGPVGLLVGGLLADIQTQLFNLSSYTACVNTFYASSIMVALDSILFYLKVAKSKRKPFKS